MKNVLYILAFVLGFCFTANAQFTHLKLEICKDSAGKTCVIEVYMADSGDFKTSIDSYIQGQLKLPVVSHVNISGAVSHEREDIVSGYVRPVALFNTVASRWQNVKHDLKKITMTVGHAKLFGNPSIGSFGYLVDPLNGVLVPRKYLQLPAGDAGAFYRAK